MIFLATIFSIDYNVLDNKTEIFCAPSDAI